MEKWQNIYANLDPIVFTVFSFDIHWYGIMYALALLSALKIANWVIKNDNISISKKSLFDYFIYVEIGILLGARIGYILFYDSNTSYYLSHPWMMFWPFMDGNFVGIRGMSYHGALIGFLLASYFYSRRYKEPFWLYMDLVAIAAPLGYVFGRIGNFLNQELIGNETTVSWGIYVFGVLRHPSQLYEAFLEGIVVFAIMMFIRRYKKFDGMLAFSYGFLYGLMRFISEFWRAPDIQLGYICCHWMTMGQILSLLMIAASILGIYLLWYQQNKIAKKLNF